jgi:hypothetical protein
MNDTEIRERLRAAVGEQSYPADLSARAEARLKQPPEVEQHPRALGLVAAILALAIIAALFGPRLLAYRNTQPRPALPPSSVVSPSPAAAQVPEADLAVVGLSGQGDLVTALKITKQFGSSQVTVIGAYADPARTVLFFRDSGAGFPMVSINDDYGFINASSSGNGGAAGDYVFILDAGPRPGADGTAHLKVSVTGFQPTAGLGSGSFVPAAWTFSFQLPLQASILVAAVPQRFLLGAWTVTLEVADATPSVVRAQVLIDGASPGDIGDAFPVTLVDAAGKPLIQTAASAGVTVPKGQLDSTTYKRTRIYAAWRRPALAGTYQLRFEGSGAVVKIPVNIPAPNAKGGSGPGPTDFPAADESLTVSGSLTANITTGRPSQCGFGTGPSGAIFAFATYFQSGSTWYWLGFYSDPSVKQYSGPGTYSAIGSLYAVGPNGPDNVLYKGTVQLTVTSDGRPDTGSVNGTLTGLEVIAPQSQVTVSGSWTCTPGPNLGPG